MLKTVTSLKAKAYVLYKYNKLHTVIEGDL